MKETVIKSFLEYKGHNIVKIIDTIYIGHFLQVTYLNYFNDICSLFFLISDIKCFWKTILREKKLKTIIK